MTNWRKQFDEEFKFTGIEHQLEGEALRQELLNFIQTKIVEQLIEDASKLAPDYAAADGNYGREGLKQQLRAKWLGKEQHD